MLRRVIVPQFERQRFETSDGDFVDVDWLRCGSSKLVVLFHGLEGCSQTWYMRGMSLAFRQTGWDVAAFNFRGCSGEPNRLLRSYHSGATDDLRELLPKLRGIGGFERTALVGFSLGGNVVLKFLGEEGEGAAKFADVAIAVSVPCDLRESAEYLARACNRLYMKRFMGFLREKMERKQAQFPDALSFSAVRRMQTFAEFDDFYTAPVHGFSGAEEYWRRCSSRRFLASIRIPALIVNAADDPFLGPACYPAREAASSKYVYLETPAHGGHNGFVAFSDGLYGAERRALAFAETTVS